MSDIVERLRDPDYIGDVAKLRHEAAAEISRLRTLCSHAGILRAQNQHNAMMAAKDAEIERLRSELDDERMRHAACGFVAMSNTRESAADQRKMLPKYFSASVQSVADAVDREMALRDEVERLRSALEAAQTAEPQSKPVGYTPASAIALLRAGTGPIGVWPLSTQCDSPVPLYAHPPQRQPLSDEEIALGAESRYQLNSWSVNAFTDGVKFAEQAHGIGSKP
jgi:hypothetical protein